MNTSFENNMTHSLLPRDAYSAKYVIAIEVVHPSVSLSVTLMYCGRIGWISSKVIT